MPEMLAFVTMQNILLHTNPYQNNHKLFKRLKNMPPWQTMTYYGGIHLHWKVWWVYSAGITVTYCELLRCWCRNTETRLTLGGMLN